MRKKYLIIFLLIILALIFSYSVLERVKLKQKVAGLSTSSKPMKISGVILPHHNLAKEIIIKSLERIAQNQNFSHIVIIGPNHFQPKSGQFVSSDKILDYQIPKEWVDNLQESQNTILDSKVVENEHSIMIPLVYLKNYFPDAMFVPLIAPPYFNKEQILKMAVFLKENLPPDTLFVASVDFSHQKMVLEAAEKNKETEEAIRNFDYEKIYQFGDDHLDSPASIGLLLNIMERLTAKNWEVWYDSHGAFFEDNYTLQGTSYLIGVFGQ